MNQLVRKSVTTGFAPPNCEKHDEQMVLYFYERPGSAPGNNWFCRSCREERLSQQTRFPEGAEL